MRTSSWHVDREGERLLLGNDGYLPGEGETSNGADRRASEPDLAPVRGVHLREEAEQRRLPGAVGSDQAEDLALGDLERGPVQAERAAVAELHLPCLEHR